MATVISLCDLTGNMVQPWVNAGHTAILIDPQHGTTRWEGPVLRYAGTVEQWCESGDFQHQYRAGNISAVFGFPPCTALAGSGARWWAEKRAADYMVQAKAVAVAEQCRTIGRLSGAPWFVENPVGALSRVFGKPQHVFDPCDYTAWDAADNYTKRTCLWVGGGFLMPQPARDLTLGPPDDRIHKAPPGPQRENFRSATPLGFARAVFDANAALAHRRVA